MDNEYPSVSRLSRYEKKRKNTKWLTLFIILGSLLIITFISVLALSRDGDDLTTDEVVTSDSDENQTGQEGVEDNGSENTSESVNTELTDTPEQEEDIIEQDPNDFELEMIDSDEENVMYAYTSTWAPITTQQSEPHEITWEQSSQDWQEMMKAAELATGVAVDDMYYLWVSGNGPQSVTTTFSNSAMNEHYRVYITWVESQGWKPDRVDVLDTHDQMENFDSSEVDAK